MLWAVPGEAKKAKSCQIKHLFVAAAFSKPNMNLLLQAKTEKLEVELETSEPAELQDGGGAAEATPPEAPLSSAGGTSKAPSLNSGVSLSSQVHL